MCALTPPSALSALLPLPAGYGMKKKNHVSLGTWGSSGGSTVSVWSAQLPSLSSVQQ